MLVKLKSQTKKYVYLWSHHVVGLLLCRSRRRSTNTIFKNMFDLEGKRNDTHLDSVLTRTNQYRECVEDPSKPAPEGSCQKDPDIFINGKHHNFLNSCKLCAPLVCTSNSTNNFSRWIESGIVSSI